MLTLLSLLCRRPSRRAPLRTRLRPCRRGGLYARPEAAADSRRGPMDASAAGARKARPTPAPGKPPRAAKFDRRGGRRARCGSGLAGRCGHRPLRGGCVGGRSAANRRCGPGGHEGRPYGPSRGLLVGADYISARPRWRNIQAPVVARACKGGYAIRPYGHASGSLGTSVIQ